MKEIEVVNIFKNVTKGLPMYPVDFITIKESYPLDNEKVRQQCIYNEVDITQFQQWYNQFVEQVPEIPDLILNELLTYFEKIMYLPANAQSLPILLEALKELRDFYNEHYIELKGPRFMENLFQELDNSIGNMIGEVSKLVGRSYNRLKRARIIGAEIK